MATSVTSKIENPKVTSPAQWVSARKALLIKEKEFTRLRDEIIRQRRELPWERVEKRYVFEGPGGKETLADLFDGRSQLIVYHFMFGPDWVEGCQSCSLLADHLAVKVCVPILGSEGLEMRLIPSFGEYHNSRSMVTLRSFPRTLGL
jgi:predicted dithiol-disulfide oxidoreductase (DUF899 family)